MEERYGICTFGVIPVRAEPSDKSELSTQLVFGDIYGVLDSDKNKKWLLIENLYDAYRGWIDALQYRVLSKANYYNIQAQNKTWVSTGLVSLAKSKMQNLVLPLGSSLHFLQNSNYFKLENQVFHFQGKAINTQEKKFDKRKLLLHTAVKFLGTPYLWGGKTALGIDCSGFTQSVFKVAGQALRRDAYQQAEQGKRLKSLSESQAGDLAFFVRKGRVIHVGIILPKSQSSFILKENDRVIIHALDTVRIDKLDHRGIFNLDRNIYTHTLAYVQRI